MTPLVAVVLGFIQGLTEFLPISSSAHVQIAEQLLGLQETPKPQLTAFIATIQLGTEFAVLIYFFKDIVRIIKAWFAALFDKTKRNLDSKMGWLIIVGSFPVVLIGLLFKDLIESDLRNLWVIAFTLIVFGVLLAWSERVGKKQRSIQMLTTKHGILFGLGQALSVIPGVSRSGSTITVGLLLGYSRQAAARYSFLLAIPAVLASGLYEFGTSYKDLAPADLQATAIATVVAFAVGFSVIVSFLKYLERGSFLPFVIWRIFVGLGLIGLLTAGVLTA